MEKRKKKKEILFISILTIFTLLSILLFFMLGFQQYSKGSTSYESIIENDDALNNFYESLSIDSAGNYIFPNDFSGIWITDESIYIGLTNINQERQSFYAELMQTSYENIKFVQQQYSYNCLESIRQKILKQYYDAFEIYHIECYVDEKENTVVFCTEKDQANWFYEITRQLPVQIIIDEKNIQFTSAISGGYRIYNANRFTAYTVSAGGTYGGYSVVVVKHFCNTTL